MATNLRFLRGTYTNLVNQPVVDGSLYITTDEPGLYVDYKAPNEAEVKRHRVGDYRVFANLDALKAHYGASKPSTSCLYYLSDDNILACYDGTNFKQINSQKDLNQLLKSFTSAAKVTSGVIEIGHTIEAANGDSKTASFSVESLDTEALKITNDGTKLKFRAKDTDTVAALSTTSNKITLTNTISGTDATGAAVNEESSTSVSFAGDGVAVTTTTAGKDSVITIKNNDTLEAAINDQGQFAITLNRNGDAGNSDSAVLTPQVQYGKGTTAIAKANTTGLFALDVYTSGQVDALISDRLAAANAMVFRGSVASQDGLPKLSDEPHIGDTYIVSENATFTAMKAGATAPSAISAMPGDLLIAQGTEGTGGTITEGLKWIYVPAADDTVTLTAQSNGNKVLITSKQGAADEKNVIQFASDDMLEWSFSDVTATISHKKQATKPQGTKDNTEQKTEDTITGIITGISYDDWGHVTGYTYRDVTVHNTRIESAAMQIKSGSAVADLTAEAQTTVGLVLTDTDGDAISAAMSFAAAEDTAIAIKTAAGNANSGPVVTIGMVWAEF